ncbi:MAG: acyl-CoA dehydratase activase [Rhodocyclaceae bacterium]
MSPGSLAPHGRYKVTFGREQVTEISCHARGSVMLFPLTRTVIDIGGQDTKAIRVGPTATSEDFTMNDKCAAGTGASSALLRFEMPLSGRAAGDEVDQPARITTTYGVRRIRNHQPPRRAGILPEDVLMGVHQAIASRCVLARRVGIESEVTFTGGVSRNTAMVRLLEEQIGIRINVSQDACISAARWARRWPNDRAGSGAAATGFGHTGGMITMYVAGIDIGSTYSKAILLDGRRSVVGTAVRCTGFKLGQASEGVFEELPQAAGVDRGDVNYVAAIIRPPHRGLPPHPGDGTHRPRPRGGAPLPDTRTILDIGGQDIKAIRVDGDGRVRAFRLNDKCAAGTGAFLEKTARYLGLTTADIGPYALRSTKPMEVSSVCAVFAESEVINHLSNGVPAEDIMMGAMVALGGRAVQLMRRVGLEAGYMLTGGMTHNEAMIKALEDSLKGKFHVAPNGLGQLNGAMGAALLGLRRVEKLLADGKPIPPTAANLGPAEAPARRRWSAVAVRKPAEPCQPGGDCPVVAKVTLHPAGAAA